MSRPDSSSPVSARSLAIALGVALALAYSTRSGDILGPLLDYEAIRGIPYGRAALVTFGDTVVMLALISLLSLKSPVSILSLSGLNRDLSRPLLWALIILGPSALLSFFTAPLGEFEMSDVLWLSIGSPFFEEVAYRGLAIGALMALCGWRFLPAALLPAAFFGVAHAAQGEGITEIVGVVAITGLGGLLFGWLFVRWNFNLWPPILLHIGMNAIWLIFDLGENAIGGWFGNAQRLLVVALSIGLTLLMAPKRR